MEGISHALHLSIVVVHIEVALDEDPEHGIEVEGVGLMVGTSP
jgi:hypothetical protein